MRECISIHIGQAGIQTGEMNSNEPCHGPDFFALVGFEIWRQCELSVCENSFSLVYNLHGRWYHSNCLGIDCIREWILSHILLRCVPAVLPSYSARTMLLCTRFPEKGQSVF